MAGKKSTLKPINIGDETLDPRADYAGALGVNERTVIRMNLPTTYIGGCAYIARNAANEAIASRISARNPRRDDSSEAS